MRLFNSNSFATATLMKVCALPSVILVVCGVFLRVHLLCCTETLLTFCGVRRGFNRLRLYTFHFWRKPAYDVLEVWSESTNRRKRPVLQCWEILEKWKKRSERRKHCALPVIRRSQKFSPRRRPLPGAPGRPKFNQLEIVTTFTYKPSLVRIDARNFELSW